MMSTSLNSSKTALIVLILKRGCYFRCARAISNGEIPSESEEEIESLSSALFIPFSALKPSNLLFTPLGTIYPVKWTYIVTDVDFKPDSASSGSDSGF